MWQDGAQGLVILRGKPYARKGEAIFSKYVHLCRVVSTKAWDVLIHTFVLLALFLHTHPHTTSDEICYMHMTKEINILKLVKLY